MPDDNETGMVKVVFPLPDADEWGIGSERVWAAPVGENLYEIRNSPWYVRDVNWGDVVHAVAANDGEWPTYVSIVRRSGHRTIQVYILEAACARRQEFLSEFSRLGASYENNSDRMYSLDCEPTVDLNAILQYLESLHNGSLIDFQTSSDVWKEYVQSRSASG